VYVIKRVQRVVVGEEARRLNIKGRCRSVVSYPSLIWWFTSDDGPTKQVTTEGTYFETKMGNLALHQPFILTSASNDSRTRGDI
jgi:hypothetical protein